MTIMMIMISTIHCRTGLTRTGRDAILASSSGASRRKGTAITTPRHSRSTRDGERYYDWKGYPFISVTTVIKQGLPKPALERWLRDQIVKTAYRDRGILANMSMDEHTKHLSGTSSERDASASLGSSVHAQVDQMVKGKEFTPNEFVVPYAEQFLRFRDAFNPTFLLTEATVYNREYGYAGTLDAMAEIDGEICVIDYKTGKRVYPEVALQLAAYANGEFVGGPDGSEIEFPRSKRGFVLHLRPDYYELRPVSIGAGIFDTFLSALDVVRWNTTTQSTVIGEPLNERAEEDRSLGTGDGQERETGIRVR